MRADHTRHVEGPAGCEAEIPSTCSENEGKLCEERKPRRDISSRKINIGMIYCANFKVIDALDLDVPENFYQVDRD